MNIAEAINVLKGLDVFFCNKANLVRKHNEFLNIKERGVKINNRVTDKDRFLLNTIDSRTSQSLRIAKRYQ